MPARATTGLAAVLGIALVTTAAFAFHAWSVQRDLREQLKRAQACVAPLPTAEPEPAPAREIAPAPVATNTAPAAGMDERQRQILELEASLRAKDDVIAMLRQSATNTPPSPESFWRGRQEWLENLKKEDPAQYAEVMKERDEARQRVREAYARKANHFLQTDTSTMTVTEQQHYDMMLKLLDDAWKISDQLRAENLPQETRRELIGSMHTTMEVLSPLLDAERDRELRSLAVALGYKEDEAASFVTYVTNILDATSVRSIIPRGGRGGPGWGRDGSPTNR